MAVAGLKKTAVFLLLAVFFVISRWHVEHRYTLPFPHYDALLSRSHGLQDAAFITFGFRALAADVAWVQLLQNMGEQGKAEEQNKSYPFLKEATLRVTRIDPYFKRAYLFGAATLAWLRTTNRPDEAMEILMEGARYNPTYWPLRTYAAGIGYMKTQQMGNMIRMLEEAAGHPDCPSIVKAVLANSYKANKRYGEAIAIWQGLLSSEMGRDYHGHAREEIPRLLELLRAANPKNPAAVRQGPSKPR